MRPVRASYLLSTVEAAAGWNLVTVSVGPDWNPVLLTLKQTPDYRSGAWPKLRAERPNEFCIRCASGDGIYSVTLQETNENYHHLQPIGRDQWLPVRGRAESQEDLNAHLYDVDGQWLRSFHVGDGIQDVQTTSDDQIWVSYFDESVLGDLPLGRKGLVCFDPMGSVLFDYSKIVGWQNVPPIVDCYAINVASKEDVWLYYYADFPLVRLRRKRLDRAWNELPVRYAHAFAASEARALFAAPDTQALLAGRQEQTNRLLLAWLDTMQVEELEPVDETGALVKSVSVFGRGTRLYLQSSEALYAVDVRDA